MLLPNLSYLCGVVDILLHTMFHGHLCYHHLVIGALSLSA